MNLLTGIVLFVFLLIALFVAAWEIGKRIVRNDIEKQNYDIQYEFIQTCMNMSCSRSFIDNQIGKLEKCPYKNDEKTELIKVERDKKYNSAKI